MGGKIRSRQPSINGGSKKDCTNFCMKVDGYIYISKVGSGLQRDCSNSRILPALFQHLHVASGILNLNPVILVQSNDLVGHALGIRRRDGERMAHGELQDGRARRVGAPRQQPAFVQEGIAVPHDVHRGDAQDALVLRVPVLRLELGGRGGGEQGGRQAEGRVGAADEDAEAEFVEGFGALFLLFVEEAECEPGSLGESEDADKVASVLGHPLLEQRADFVFVAAILVDPPPVGAHAFEERQHPGARRADERAVDEDKAEVLC